MRISTTKIPHSSGGVNNRQTSSFLFLKSSLPTMYLSKDPSCMIFFCFSFCSFQVFDLKVFFCFHDCHFKHILGHAHKFTQPSKAKPPTTSLIRHLMYKANLKIFLPSLSSIKSVK